MDRYTARHARDTFLTVLAITIDVFSLWTHTMNRCFLLFTRRITQRIQLALLVICVGALVSFPTSTLAQSAVRPFPADAKRGVMQMQDANSLVINGTPERLSPGSRIRGVNNMLVMSGQLIGQKVVVNYTRDTAGLVHLVWILNGLEARQERPGSEPTTNVIFESTPPKPSSYFK